MSRKRMAGLGRLSDFGPTGQAEETGASGDGTVVPEAGAGTSGDEREKRVTVNVKIARSQQQWLQARSQQVRDNNLDPVPASQRVFPQHLIGVAIELLERQELDWAQVRTVEDLRRLLELL